MDENSENSRILERKTFTSPTEVAGDGSRWETSENVVDSMLSSSGKLISDSLTKVKIMIAQNCIEVSIVLVIVIYLIYYFSQISRVGSGEMNAPLPLAR